MTDEADSGLNKENNLRGIFLNAKRNQTVLCIQVPFPTVSENKSLTAHNACLPFPPADSTAVVIYKTPHLEN